MHGYLFYFTPIVNTLPPNSIKNQRTPEIWTMFFQITFSGMHGLPKY